MSIEQESTSSILSFFGNPVIGFIGSVASFFGLIAAFYFYEQSKMFPELTFLKNTTITNIVSSKQATKIKVFHDEKEILTDIKAIQIAFWNAGNKGIKPEHILEPINIILKPGASILETAVVMKSRELIGIEIDESDVKNGKIALSWKILEKNDGATIQLIYASDSYQEITLSGVIEGQKEIKLINSRPLKIQKTDPLTDKFGRKVSSIIFFSISLFSFLIGLIEFKTRIFSLKTKILMEKIKKTMKIKEPTGVFIIVDKLGNLIFTFIWLVFLPVNRWGMLILGMAYLVIASNLIIVPDNDILPIFL